MRRLLGLALTGLLSAALLILPLAGAGLADTGSALVLAAEEGGGGEGEAPPGPEPMDPNEDPTKNPAAPVDYEANFLWGAAVGLLVLTLFAVAAVGGLYYLLVVRPRQREDAAA